MSDALAAACSRCAELQSAYDDFQSQSQELEAELELELAQANQQVDTLKTKLEKATSALASERDSGKSALVSLQSQISNLQGELTRSHTQLDTLKAAKRALEQSQSDLETRLRRAEAQYEDAREMADHHAEQVVLLNQDLLDERIKREEIEQRSKTVMREMKADLLQHGRTSNAAPADDAAAAAAEPATNGTDTAHSDHAAANAALLEEIALLQDEKQQLNQDLEEVTTDLTRVQEENEELVKQLEEMTTLSNAPVGSPAADQERIAELETQLAERDALGRKSLPNDIARIAELEAALDTLKASTTTELAEKQKEIAQHLALISELRAQLESSLADSHQYATKLEALELRMKDALQTIESKQSQIEQLTRQCERDRALAESAASGASATEADAAATSVQVASLESALESAKSEIRTVREQLTKEKETRAEYEKDIAALAALRKERMTLQQQILDLTTESTHFAEQFQAWSVEKRELQQRADLEKQERLALEAQIEAEKVADIRSGNNNTPYANGGGSENGEASTLPTSVSSNAINSLAATSSAVGTTSNGTPHARSTSSFSFAADGSATFLSPSPAPISTSGEAAQIQLLLARDIDGLKQELTKLEPTVAGSAVQLVETLNNDVATSLSMLIQLQTSLAAATDRELDLMHRLQDAKGTNIRVFCRVRPMNANELAEARNQENLLQYTSEQQISIRTDAGKKQRMIAGSVPTSNGKDEAGDKEEEDGESAPATSAPADYTPFNFDQIFSPQTTQEEVYAAVEEQILPVLNGYNSTIFAYGQTGSGKTYTMGSSEKSDENDPHVGITFRSLRTLFRGIANRGGTYKYELRMTLVELYNEQWADLLAGATDGAPVTESNELIDGLVADDDESVAASSSSSPDPETGDKKTKLAVRQGQHGMYIDGATTRVVSNISEVFALLQHGAKHRHVESTQMNATSSRSHLIMTVDVIGVNQTTQVTSRGKLTLVDLAGSERVKATGSSGQRLVEASHINRSLSALADVFTALAEGKAKHIPFRNNRLTHYLKFSFVGASKTLMFVNISPALQHAGETLCSLQFAARARLVKLDKAQASLDGFSHKYKAMLEAQAASFNTREKNALAQVKAAKALVKARDKTVETLTAQLKQLQEKADQERRERMELERAKKDSSSSSSGPTKEQRKNEVEEDKKWAQMQNENDKLKGSVTELKQSLLMQTNDAKEKYAVAEGKIKELNEKLRVQRMEWLQSKKQSAQPTDEDAVDSSAEVERLTRQVALLELEVRRLKITRTAALSVAAKTKIQTPVKAAPQSDESKESNPTPAAASSSIPAPSTPAPTRLVFNSTPRTSPVAAVAGSPSTGRGASALVAAKQAAQLAQQRVASAQAKREAAAASSAASHTTDFDAQRNRSTSIGRRSLLPSRSSSNLPAVTIPKPSSSRTRTSMVPSAPQSGASTPKAADDPADEIPDLPKATNGTMTTKPKGHTKNASSLHAVAFAPPTRPPPKRHATLSKPLTPTLTAASSSTAAVPATRPLVANAATGKLTQPKSASSSDASDSSSSSSSAKATSAIPAPGTKSMLKAPTTFTTTTPKK